MLTNARATATASTSGPCPRLLSPSWKAAAPGAPSASASAAKAGKLDGPPGKTEIASHRAGTAPFKK
jgi:hypothetical protein